MSTERDDAMQPGSTENEDLAGETSRADKDLIRIAEAIADRSPVNWQREISETPVTDGPWSELQTIESIASFHAQGELAVDSTPLAEQGEAGDELPTAWGNLFIRDRLGKGACASVYRAYDPTLDREVALKVPHRRDSSFARSFLCEARRLARIDHDSVVKVHGADECDGRVGMWMDLVEGRTLEDNLAIHGPFSANEATLIGIDLCRALAAVHGAGLLHRDVKAANVMRQEGGRIVLMDFSSVVEARSELSDSDDSSTQGTPYYMAPEVLGGEDATSASDIYSLGVLLYRLVTGRYPVEAESYSELRGKLTREGAPSLLDARPDLPVGFVQVIDRALASAPDDRYSTAGEMERALGGSAFNHVPAPIPDEDPKKHLSGRVVSGLIAAAVIGVAIVMIFVMAMPTPLAVEAALYRRGEVVNERLAPGDQLALGDRLFLEVRGSQPLHVYVLNEDAAGRRHRLFPLESLVLGNPLAAGVEHRLPGSIKPEESSDPNDTDRYWEVTTGGGEETVMLIASTEPLEGFEERILGIAPASETMERGERLFRGIDGLSPGPTTRQKLSLEELRAELEKGHEGELEIWQIRLMNPAVDDGS